MILKKLLYGKDHKIKIKKYHAARVTWPLKQTGQILEEGMFSAVDPALDACNEGVASRLFNTR